MLLASSHYDHTCVLLGRVQLCLSHVRVAQHRESLGHSGDSSLIVHQQTPCFISLTLGRFLPHSREGGWCSARIAGERRLANAACAAVEGTIRPSEQCQTKPNECTLAKGHCTQRTQYPLIKEYTLNQNIKPPITQGIILS